MMNNSRARKARPINSCEVCRRRRLKCDKVRPSCGRCVETGIDCSYTPAIAPEGSDSQHTTQQNIDLASTAAHTVSGYPNQDVLDHGILFTQEGGRSIYRGSTYWGNVISSDVQADSDIAHVASSAKWPPDNTEFEAQNKKVGPLSHHIRRSRRDSSVKCRRCGERYRLQCVLSILPKQAVCEKLIDVFFTNVFTLTPILHLPTFVADQKEFWKSQAQRDASCHPSEPGPFLESKPSFIALYFSMLFAAVKCSRASVLEDLIDYDQIPNVADLFFGATISTKLTGFPRRPSLYALAGFIFTQSQLIREEEFADAPTFIETAFRVALGMGLHRDSNNFGLADSERELRRRLWWHIVHLDVMASTSSGLSPLWLDEKMANTSLISKYEDFHESDTDQHVDLRYIIAIHRYRCTREIRHILISHFDNELRTFSQVRGIENRLHALDAEFKTMIQALLKTQRTVGHEDETPTQGLPAETLHSVMSVPEHVWSLDGNVGGQHPAVKGFRTWAAILLHLMIHKAFLVLYHPLFRSGNGDLKSKALRHSQAFVQLFIRMCDHPACDAYRWMYPGTYQPLQALSILLADLTENPSSEHAGTSRGLIDATFQLYEVDEGIVGYRDREDSGDTRRLSPFGRQAWSMLIRTRKKALEQMGKDPHVLFPSSILSENTCVCGEEIAVGELGEQGQDASAEQSGESPREDTPASAFERHFIPSMGETGFNWEEWDSLLGNETGILT